MLRNYRPEMTRFFVGPIAPFTHRLLSIISTILEVPCADIVIEVPRNQSLGDLAFPLQRITSIRSKDRAELSRLLDEVKAAILEEKFVAEVQFKGMYLNIFFQRETLMLEILTSVLTDLDYGNSSGGRGRKVMVEYSSPNTNKPLHLGHVRNNVIGMAVSNLLEASGSEVVRTCLVNDRGVHICKSMLAYMSFGQNATPELAQMKGDHFVGDFYVAYEKALKEERAEWLSAKGIDFGSLPSREQDAVERDFIAESKLAQQAQELLNRWEAGDDETRRLWERMNSWVYEGFAETYQLLGSRFDKTYYESETYELGRAIVHDGLRRGVFKMRDDGAIIVELGELDTKVLIRSDETTVYLTQDLGTAKLKFDDYGLDSSVYVVADEQIHHFQVLFACLGLLGFEWAKSCYHLSYGMVELPEGKMKSREGTVVDADELIVELKTMARERIEASLAKPGETFHEAEEKTDARALAIAMSAIKFYFLKYSPRSRVLFNPRKSLDFEGMTGPYLQYVVARINGILERADQAQEKGRLDVLSTDEEFALTKMLGFFPGVIAESALKYDSAILANYLAELARAFNTWYHSHPVINAETPEIQRARLQFIQAISRVMRRGLELLGIQVVERM